MLSRDLPVNHIPLESIAEVDSAYWFTGNPQSATVRAIVEHIRMVQATDLAHPIILGVDGRVMDGMHRIARAMLEGHSSIRAVQFEVHPAPDYRHCDPDALPY